MTILLITVIFAAATLASFFGLGGGVLYTPFQWWLGTPLKEAAATSLLLVLITSLSATSVYRRSHRVDWSLALVLEIPTTLGAYLGGLASAWLPTWTLGVLLAVLLVSAGYLMLRPVRPQTFPRASSRAATQRLWYWARHWEGQLYWIDLRWAIFTMLSAGFLVSMVGISGGVLKVPLMVLLMGVPLPVAVGSSAFMVGLTALAGMLGHAAVGHVNWQAALLLGLPAAVGAQVGSHVSVHLETRRVRRYYGWFLISVALITLLRLAAA